LPSRVQIPSCSNKWSRLFWAWATSACG
jgi:hypothetical protein